jgi:hypothetical protein
MAGFGCLPRPPSGISGTPGLGIEPESIRDVVGRCAGFLKQADVRIRFEELAPMLGAMRHIP